MVVSSLTRALQTKKMVAGLQLISNELVTRAATMPATTASRLVVTQQPRLMLVTAVAQHRQCPPRPPTQEAGAARRRIRRPALPHRYRWKACSEPSARMSVAGAFPVARCLLPVCHRAEARDAPGVSVCHADAAASAGCCRDHYALPPQRYEQHAVGQPRALLPSLPVLLTLLEPSILPSCGCNSAVAGA